MARIRVRAGGSEIEVDSRDFYVHNETVHSVIEDLSRYLLPLHHEPGVGDDDGGSSGRVDGAAAAGGAS